MGVFGGDGIGIAIRDNQALADILDDIIIRAEADGKPSGFSGKDYQAIFRTLIASLKTVIALLRVAARREGQGQAQANQTQPMKNNQQQGQQQANQNRQQNPQ